MALHPNHVVQRGNNKEKVFINEEDKKKYLSLLKEYSGKWDTYILAYCLMNNHVHLLTRPIKNESLYKMMQGITLCYTQYFNRTYERTGRLWESRYPSCVVDKEKYLWAVARYIEQNPERVKIVKKAAHGKSDGLGITSLKTSGNPSAPGKTARWNSPASFTNALRGGASWRSKWWTSLAMTR